ncbi:MAG TPA: GNAT family N-acetyltransferase [Longimicrobiales bacterium]
MGDQGGRGGAGPGPADEQPAGLIPESARLRFRTWDAADLPLALRLWGDPAVTRYLARGPLSEDAIRARLEREHASLARYGFQYWPMFLRADDRFVGCCGLKVSPYEGGPDATELELGFHLVPDMWGQGLATEAATAVAHVAFDRLHAARVFAGHHPENAASRAVLNKLGFSFVRDVLFEPTGLMHPLYVLEPHRLAG